MLKEREGRGYKRDKSEERSEHEHVFSELQHGWPKPTHRKVRDEWDTRANLRNTILVG